LARGGQDFARRVEVDLVEELDEVDHVTLAAAFPAQPLLLFDIQGEPVVAAASRAWADESAAALSLQPEPAVPHHVLDSLAARPLDPGLVLR
jgi:hypothetical protein